MVSSLLEAAVVTIVFIKLKTPGIAVTIFTTVIFYFLFTIFMTRWRYVSIQNPFPPLSNTVSHFVLTRMCISSGTGTNIGGT